MACPTGLRDSLFCLLFLLFLTGATTWIWFFWNHYPPARRTTNEERLNVSRRWLSIDEHDVLNSPKMNITHLYMTNSWYRYVMLLAKERNRSDCYVCSVIPASSLHPNLQAKQFSEWKSDCVIEYSTRGYISTGAVTTSNGTLVRPSCKSLYQFKKLKLTKSLAPYASVEPGTVFPHCVTNNGTEFLGTLPTKMCHELLVPFTVQIINDRVSHGYAVPCPRGRCVGSNPDLMPGNNGTYVVDQMFWLCGQALYLSLPRDWSGICAPVKVTDHTFIVSAVHEPHLRHRRNLIDVKPHDSIWGSDVPGDHKLWNTGQKVTMALFPWVGTAKNALRIETIDYRLGLFLNATIKAFKGYNEEMSSMRLMVLQNRLVLDLLVAQEGGVCKMLNDTCCTFIPDNTDEGHSVTEALHQLEKVQQAMQDDRKPQSWDFFSWFAFGSWWQLLLKIVTPILMVLIICCVFTMCIFPCIQSMISRAVNGGVQSVLLSQEYNLLLKGEQDDCNDFEIEMT
ncbi:uncharacterized protein LOC101166204 isoform X3 [Oryzias latipes]|uniref:uncharacterized protein LOC101166204 isoform X3 n=1 Tax=Oryzias latipes TaxID=8090 RepID=UPI000CE1A0ED|nr:uncharacterized protein LOC101166204 isoform X3 [Oryzias latipes]